jgi:hypothetical protein
MRVVLTVLCILTFLGGCSILTGAKSAIHEIEAFMVFLISAVFLVGAALLDAISDARKKFAAMIDSSSAAARHASEVVAVLREQLSLLTAQHTQATPPARGTRKAVPGQTYYYAADEGDMGPHTAEDIREFREAGMVIDDTLIFREGDTQWRACKYFPDLLVRSPPT